MRITFDNLYYLKTMEKIQHCDQIFFSCAGDITQDKNEVKTAATPKTVNSEIPSANQGTYL